MIFAWNFASRSPVADIAILHLSTAVAFLTWYQHKVFCNFSLMVMALLVVEIVAGEEDQSQMMATATVALSEALNLIT